MNKLETLVFKLHSERPESVYALEAYLFVLQSVEFVMESLPQRRHITAQELLRGALRLAVQEFGPMAYSVWKHWGIRIPKDYGHIVFDLVDSGLLAKRPEDDLRDFMLDWNLEALLEESFRKSQGDGS